VGVRATIRVRARVGIRADLALFRQTDVINVMLKSLPYSVCGCVLCHQLDQRLKIDTVEKCKIVLYDTNEPRSNKC
jgi:hypothetical protein